MVDRNLLKTGFFIFNMRIVGALFQFFFQILISREFGVAGYGAFSLAFTITVIASVFARWGADQWVLRELAQCLGTNNQRNWFAVFLNGFLFVCISSLVIASLLIAVSYSSYVQLSEAEVTLMRYMFIALVPFTVLNFVAEAFRSINQQLLASVIQGILIPFFSIIFFLFAVKIYQINSLSIVGLIYLLVCTLVFLIAASLWIKSSEVLGRREFYWLGSNFLKEVTPIALITIVTALLGFTDIVVIGLFHPSSEVGIYAAAQRLVLLLSFIILSLNNIVGPKFASFYSEKNYRALFELYSTSTRLLIYLMLPIAGLVAIFSTPLLSLFGKEFTQANQILWLLLAGQVINIATGPVGVLMIMSSHTIQLKQFTLLVLVIHFSLTFILTPKFGALGAAIASFSSGSFLNLICWVYVKNMRKLYSHE